MNSRNPQDKRLYKCTSVSLQRTTSQSNRFWMLEVLYVIKLLLQNWKFFFVCLFQCVFWFFFVFLKDYFKESQLRASVTAVSFSQFCSPVAGFEGLCRIYLQCCIYLCHVFLNMHQWLPEGLWMRNCYHPLSNRNKEGGHCVHWFDKGLTCFLYCKVVMGSFITHRAPWHFTC